MGRIVRRDSIEISMYLFFLCWACAIGLGDGVADQKNTGTTGSGLIGEQTDLAELISSGALEKPPILRGKIYYGGNDTKSIPVGSMNDLLQLYRDEELLNVTELSWSACKFESIEGLNRLPNLKILRLGGNRIGAISGLESCSKLETIGLSQNKIERIEGLDFLPNLRELSLSNNKIGRIEGLESLKNLEVLMLEGNQITEIAGLSDLPALRRLGLAGNRLRDVSGLLELGHLQEISIESLYNEFGEKAIEIINDWNHEHPTMQLRWR
jgi:hypothetical protein